MNEPVGGEIEVVRGELEGERADAVGRFLAEHGAAGEDAEKRLPQVQCLLTDGEGEIAGVGTAYASDVPLLGRRRFWVYEGFLRPGFESMGQDLIRAAHNSLGEGFDPDGDDPIGLCVLLIGEEIERRPEAEWSDPRMFYAGYVDRRAQVRVGYFEGAKIEPQSNRGQGSATPIGDPGALPGFDIRPFAGHPRVTEEDVLALWAREGALSGQEARERVSQVVLAATGEAGELVGVSTAWLRRNEQLWMEMWHYRVFVGAAHRQSHLAVALTLATREHLKERFVSGEDTRAGGIAMAIQNPVLRRLDDAIWKATDFAFFGVNSRNDPLRVHYFPGAKAPGPPLG